MDEVLFCPFCGEAFEGLTHCPEHELGLLPWAQLPGAAERALPERESLAWFSPRLGRGWVAASALLWLLAFAALPLGNVSGSLHMGGSMLQLALRGTPRLWLLPVAAWAELAILYRRRSPHALRGARLAVVLVGCVPLLSAVSTWFSARRAVALLAARDGQQLQLHVGSGLYAVALASLPLIVAGLRLGVPPRRAHPLDQGRIDSGR